MTSLSESVSLTAIGLDVTTALSGAATALANVGPGFGETIGPVGSFADLPDSAKIILIIGMIGYYILRVAPRSGGSRRGGKGVGGFLILGIGLMVIGFAGTFFGNLIKAAVNEAARKVDETMQGKMGSMASSLPGIF